MSLNIRMSGIVAIELNTGEILIGEIVDPIEGSLSFLNKLGDGIFLKRSRHISYLSVETIKNIRRALPFEKEVDNKY